MISFSAFYLPHPCMTNREFDQHFRKLYLPLCMYALRMVGDIDIAEDMVSNAFLKAWVYIMEEGKNPEFFKAFIYQSVRNECISWLRSRKQMLAIEEFQEISEEAIDTSDRDARVWKAIDSLPDRCREVFLLSKRDGLTQEEIASELNISIKTVKNQMTKAYERLREALSNGHKPFFLPFL